MTGLFVQLPRSSHGRLLSLDSGSTNGFSILINSFSALSVGNVDRLWRLEGQILPLLILSVLLCMSELVVIT